MGRISILGVGIGAAIAHAMLATTDTTGMPSRYVRNIKTEPVRSGKSREDFPSRQAYRAYLRQLGKSHKNKGDSC